MFKCFRVAVLLSLCLLFFAAPPASAFGCPDSSLQGDLSRSQSIVYGRLYKVETTDALVHTIVAEKVYKGDPPTPIAARYTGTGATSPFEPGKLYTFYLDKDEKGNWLLSPCARSHEGLPTAEEAALFGPGRPPAPPDTSKLWIPIVAISVAVGGVLAVLLRNRLGRRPE
jgi:hypothetical protein